MKRDPYDTFEPYKPGNRWKHKAISMAANLLRIQVKWDGIPCGKYRGARTLKKICQRCEASQSDASVGTP